MKYVILGSLVLIFFLSLFFYQKTALDDQKLHVTVCDVGQGDAIFIRTPTGKNILYDGGPDSRVLECLFWNMPVWDRRIDVVILSHPHADHLNGLIDVLATYRVKKFVTEELANTTEGYKELERAVEAEGLKPEYLLKGDRIQTLDGVILTVLAPTAEYLELSSGTGGVISQGGEFANLILHLQYKEFDMLLTGDSQVEQVSAAVVDILPQFEALQVPHHGSRTGLSEILINKLHVNEAVISVGENSYGHPHPRTLQILSKAQVDILRTDKQGQINIVSDGNTYSLK